ncbi:LysM peptidoglycan-binding domain-containing protein [Geotalea sp. SG265]|uniref:LysM peptidoglycan-binding domain-containing protein n=1 Tax=Geotalea sp. SG265 TaxID=2922867 RepID=UPI001FAEEDF6|nr:LysM peptidoglycan-binding domain-containing protein [Geotalea sp. SG265]
MITVRRGLIAVALFALFATGAGAAVDSPFEINIKELDGRAAPAPPKRKAPVAKPSRTMAAKAHAGKPKPLAGSDGHASYTVRNGDHIFKILMKHFGMTNAAAEALIPEVIRLNRVSDIKRLTVGQTLLIPSRHGRTKVADKKEPAISTAMEPAIQQRITTAQLGEAPAGAAIAVRSITSRDPAEVTDAILNILAVKPGKDHFVEASAATRQALRLGAKVDRFFESNDKHYMISFSATEPFTYTVYRLLELEGVRLIRIDQDADLKQVATAVLSAMNIPYRYGEHAVILNDRNHTSATLKGFLFTRETTIPPRLILLSDMPVAALTASLLESKERNQR